MEYRWSSVHVHLGLRASSRVSLHPGYLALGNDSASRAAAYQALLLEPLAGDQLSSIRNHMRQERALGCPNFQAMVEKTLNRPAQLRVAGRPRREQGDSNGNVL